MYLVGEPQAERVGMTPTSTLNNNRVRPSAFVHFELKAPPRGAGAVFLRVLKERDAFGAEVVTFITYDQEHY